MDRCRPDVRFVSTLAAWLVLANGPLLIAATWRVPADRTTIQGAIDAAADGDTILVDPDTYHETINFLGKAVRLTSVSMNPADTVIDAWGGLHVVQCVTGEGDDTILEGFTITGGNASGTVFPDNCGGGMYNYNSSPFVNNCLFTSNAASTFGGGMYNSGGSPKITYCTFSMNSVVGDLWSGGPYSGGGMYNDHSDPNIINCTFHANGVEGYLGYGGGLSNNQSSPRLTGCAFNSNTAEGYYSHGGGIDGYRSDSVVTGCTFTSNASDYTGGGMHNKQGSPVLTDCAFTDNTSGTGGGMYNDSWPDVTAGNRVTLTDCAFSNNASITAGGGIYNTYCDSELIRCTFRNNSNLGSIYGGGGIFNDRSNSTLIQCSFRGNSATTGAGGGLYNMAASTADVIGCNFSGNRAHYCGCGMYNEGTATVVNCTFSDNSGSLYTHSAGGGMSDRGTSSTVINCIFKGNSAGFGGGMFNQNSISVTVINCTFSGNAATLDGSGGGIYNRDCNPVISNCIIWGNIGEQIYNYYGTAVPDVTYSCIQGGYPGAGNINGNPVFDGVDLRIMPPSPCIDAGNNDALPPDSLDLDEDGNTSESIPFDRHFKIRRADEPMVEPDTGNPGTVGPPVVDMGACEVSAVFVDDDAPLGGDGGSWATAFKYLQDAFYHAAGPLNNRGDIRVAQGTYYPDQSETGHGTPADRAASFELHSGLAVRGGYRGLGGGGLPDDRDITLFECVLSGDYGDNDDPNDPNSYDENSYHVLRCVDADLPLLEGFTITGGNANGTGEHRDGGGMYNNGSSPVVSQCAFLANRAEYDGGGMANVESIPTVIRCNFSGNVAGSGGGMKNWDSYVKVVDCIFNGNSAMSFSGKGGIGNSRSTATLTNCTFTGNTGCGVYGWYADLTITNCTFSNNFSPAGAGGLSLVLDSSLTMTNCIFWGNVGYLGYPHSHIGPSQLSVGPDIDPTITYCYFQESDRYCLDPDDHNTCIHPFLGNPLFGRDPDDGGDGWANDPNTPENEAANNDYGDLHLLPGSPCIEAGTNQADTDGQTPEIDPLPAGDLAGRDRIIDGDCDGDAVVDIGAYEYDRGLLGDCSGDCVVNLVDYVIFAAHWLEAGCDDGNDWCARADIDRRDGVRLDDLLLLVQHWLWGLP
ncbi:MAG: right-handed parallel beta-helix repeat-containing protein [Sedimentisphaerales bacterium]|nr:right-handed parallel beta-helix repeat-containing protein [Sedimentisphaerales bacterium]